ncbi:hypothetical protein EVAR_94606_1 [Eumeta japonica]|uniref:Uncharacterized protein n=1 Tax=Eumeta variegata TaxID=151549 RepID=A0A4C1UUV6_EUMVA|nr:hypothetical protein EVAR_94606_1 [Eumeta japonica]
MGGIEVVPTFPRLVETSRAIKESGRYNILDRWLNHPKSRMLSSPQPRSSAAPDPHRLSVESPRQDPSLKKQKVPAKKIVYEAYGGRKPVIKMRLMISKEVSGSNELQ